MSVLSQQSSLGQGSFWFSLTSIMSKGMSFLTQIVLGWYLVPEEFGLYAIALALSAWGLAFRNGGTDQYLIQQGQRYEELAPRILSYSLLFNAFACCLLIAVGVIAARYYQAPELLLMMSLIGVAQVLTSPAVIMRAKLSINQQYMAFSFVTLMSDSGRQISAMLLAFAGAGVFAFVIPMAIEPLLSALGVYLIVRVIPKPGWFSLNWLREVFADCKWLMFSNFAMALTMSGIYFVLSFILAKDSLGVLFFGLQLVTAISVPVTNGLQQIFFAHLSNGIEHKDRKRLVLHSAWLLFVLMLLVSLGLYVLAPPFVNYIWSGKWDQAIDLIKICTLTLPVTALSHLVFAVVSAEAKWRLRCMLVLCTALIDMTVVGLVALFASFESIPAALVLSRSLSALGAMYILCRLYRFTAFSAINVFGVSFTWLAFVFLLVECVDLPFWSWISVGLTVVSVGLLVGVIRGLRQFRNNTVLVS